MPNQRWANSSGLILKRSAICLCHAKKMVDSIYIGTSKVNPRPLMFASLKDYAFR